MSEHPTTDNHNFARPEAGTLEDQWGDIINSELIDPLEERTPVVGVAPAEATPYAGGMLVNNGSIYTGDGLAWSEIDIASEAWVSANFNNYTFSESYNDLTDVPTTFTPASHGNESHDVTFAVDGDAQPAESHNLGGSEHNADTLANLNLLVSDATLDDAGASRPPETHGMAAHDTTVASASDLSDHESAANPHSGSASETWVTNNFNNYTFSEVYGDLTERSHGNEDHTTNYTDTEPADVTSANWGDYEIQVDGTDGAGIINFKTQ